MGRVRTGGGPGAVADPSSIDVLDPFGASEAWWTTTNFGEAVPGVLTALNWSFWSELGEIATRRTFATIGTLDREEVRLPPIGDERFIGIFRGRVAGNVSRMGAMGDRIPGASGADLAVSMFGEQPPGFPSAPSRRYYHRVLTRLPPVFIGMPRRVRRVHDESAGWWRREIATVAADGLDSARAQFRRAQGWFSRAMYLQILNNLAAVTPVYDAVTALATKAGDPELAGPLLGGQGSHAELALVEGLWEVSRGRLEIDDFVAEHGFHGPWEGEISSRVWREDPTPVLALVERYRVRPEEESPEALIRDRASERTAARAELLERVGRRGRPGAELVLSLAARYNPTRGLGKAAFLRSLDVARAASRAAGESLARSGALDDPGDVFHLTAGELLSADPSLSLTELVDVRRAQREAHEAVAIPAAWHGRPEVIIQVAPHASDDGDLSGTGVSNGVVEGTVRVVMDPGLGDIQDGEILVAPITDPSWAAVMYCSAGLVVEVGGAMSHAAVVARELGLPCVMGVEGATSRLASGDVCRIDGHAGTIEVLRRAR